MMRVSSNEPYFAMLANPNFKLGYYTSMSLPVFAKTLNAITIKGISETNYKKIKKDLLGERLLKYFNIGYQWQYMLQSLTIDHHAKIFGDYNKYSDSIIVSFSDKNSNYFLNNNYSNNKVILNPIGLFAF
ncbi:hypothetical protein [Spiroplasma endosymbiont of Virgichneumon dumeticola]|uniref:hypothetical protein n=1 Tax=Spiroplasma endosymbiont of Virgichneumon dumeticola TaxID=3139323 RepID=UPI0035C90899